MSKYCEICGTSNADSDIRCISCGNALSQKPEIEAPYYVCANCKAKTHDPNKKCSNCGVFHFYREGGIYCGNALQKPVDTGRLRNFAIGALVCILLTLHFAYQPLYHFGDPEYAFGVFDIGESSMDEIQDVGSIMSVMLVVGTILSPVGLIVFAANPEPDKKWPIYLTAIGEVLVMIAVLFPFIIAFSFAMSEASGGGSFSDAYELVGCHFTASGWLTLLCYVVSSILVFPVSKAIRENAPKR